VIHKLAAIRHYSPMTNPWLLLILAGICEIGWPLGYKMAQAHDGLRQTGWFAFSGLSIVLSAWLLWLAQKEIPIGTAYAVWTGIGAAGTFVLGILLFGEQSSMLRWLGAAMIIGGVIILKAGN
jgi:quaternary ammonium compound-resistance protein SugE